MGLCKRCGADLEYTHYEECPCCVDTHDQQSDDEDGIDEDGIDEKEKETKKWTYRLQ